MPRIGAIHGIAPIFRAAPACKSLLVFSQVHRIPEMSNNAK